MSVKYNMIVKLLFIGTAMLVQRTNGVRMAQSAQEKLEEQDLLAVVESWRYYDGDDNKLDLVQNQNHARIVLDRGMGLAQSDEDDESSDPCADHPNKKKEVCIEMKNDKNLAYMATIYLGTPP